MKRIVAAIQKKTETANNINTIIIDRRFFMS